MEFHAQNRTRPKRAPSKLFRDNTHPLKNKGTDKRRQFLALARLEAAIGLVDHIKPATAANDPVIPMAFHQRFQRVLDFHLTPSITAHK